jgi:hypothetical protein
MVSGMKESNKKKEERRKQKEKRTVLWPQNGQNFVSITPQWLGGEVVQHKRKRIEAKEHERRIIVIIV